MLNYYRNVAFSTKLMLLAMTTSIIAICIVSAVAYYVNSMSAFEDFYSGLKVVAKVVANRSAAAIDFEDQQLAEENLQVLSIKDAIYLGCMYKENRGYFASHAIGDQGAQCPPLLGLSETVSDNSVTIIEPIVFEKKLGTLVVFAHLDALHEENRALLKALILTGLLAAIAALFLASYLKKIVMHPINALKATIAKVHEQLDYSLRARKINRDELGDLTDDFNQMLEKIQFDTEALIFSENNKLQGHVGSLLDITDLKQAQHQLEKIALYDTLTNVANRALFKNRLKKSIHHSKRHNLNIGLIFLDIDNFKRINDTMGHEAGDQLLKVVADRIKSCVREVDTVGRLGGDEFVVLVDSVNSRKITDNIASQLVERIREPIRIYQHNIVVTTSLGITLAPEDDTTVSGLMKNADMAMYRAKSSGKDTFQYYCRDMDLAMLHKMNIEKELRAALEAQELMIVYQQQYDLEKDRVSGYESLLRWQSPTRGLVSPAEFIPIAEETGLIHRVGDWNIETVCRDTVVLIREGKLPVDGRISINLSVKQFRHADFLKRFIKIAKSTGVNFKNIELEITETLLMEEFTHAVQLLDHLKSLGVSIAVDDFGTGYSSLSYLKRLPIDYIKVDKSFIDGIPNDNYDVEITSAIIAMSHKLGLSVIAEGVETVDQLKFLKNNQCDHVQGFYFGKGEALEGYDLIGDIHGCADSLEALLRVMGYREQNGRYCHPDRQVIFLGDYIDRGPKQEKTIEIVRSMVESGQAKAIMGNHEFNAIAFHTPDPDESAGHLRRRSERTIKQHQAFLDEYEGRPKAWKEVIEWFRQLPLWLDLGGLRAVHACWDPASIACLQPQVEPEKPLCHSLLQAACCESSQEYQAIEILLKGKELALPAGHYYYDKEGTRRHRIRVRWWDVDVTSYRDAYMGPEEARLGIPDDEVEGDYLLEYGDESPPLFFGHYWLSGRPQPLAANIACLDYSIAKPGGALVAYRWGGEQRLIREHFVRVERVEL